MKDIVFGSCVNFLVCERFGPKPLTTRNPASPICITSKVSEFGEECHRSCTKHYARPPKGIFPDTLYPYAACSIGCRFEPTNAAAWKKGAHLFADPTLTSATPRRTTEFRNPTLPEWMSWHPSRSPSLRPIHQPTTARRHRLPY